MNLQEQISRMKSMMGVIDEQTNNKTVKIYKDGVGNDNAYNYKGNVINISIKDTLVNEPNKDKSYMKTNDEAKDLINSIKNNEKIEPIKVIKHPYDSSKYIIIDGHHRRYSYIQAGVDKVPAIIISPKDIVLVKKDYGKNNNNNDNIKLNDVYQDKEIIDKYFTKPDGTNKFKKQKSSKE